MITAAILAVIYLIMGITWFDLIVLVGGFAVATYVFATVVCLVAAYVQNRKVLRAGARWAAGSDKARIRIDTPVLTLVIPRSHVESLVRSGDLVFLRLRPKQTMAVPAALLPGMLSDPGFEHLID